MATVQDHYSNVLSDVYSWMFGGFCSGIERNTSFFQNQAINPHLSGIAIDLGAGCGFQSIPLAQAGFSVTAIDLDSKLLKELTKNAGPLKIDCFQNDLSNFESYVKKPVELIVCMTDTILHLESKDKVYSLFGKVIAALENGGKFIITFRDLSNELLELDRFIPVRSDDNIIFTCFLEYEPETVKVHDIVYKSNNEKWTLYKSFYRKLRLSKDWVESQLSHFGFNSIDSTVDKGFVSVIATK